MKTKTPEDARRAATKAGRLHAVRQGRPPAPWTREDREFADAIYRNYMRKYRINTGPMLPR